VRKTEEQALDAQEQLGSTTLVICFIFSLLDILFAQFTYLSMRTLSGLSANGSLMLWFAAFASAATIAAASVRAFESEESKAKRLELKRQKEARALAERISKYARTVHQQFPTGDVVVSQGDLAEQLRRRTDVVVTALNLLLKEQRVQRAPLSGYWKLR
jgi:hypothetical protein